MSNSAPQIPIDKVTRRRRVIRSFEARMLSNRAFSHKIADWVTESVGSVAFLNLNLYWFFIWILLNTNVIPGVVPFDPYPFGFLTMIVSLEAILLSVFVLLSQNRAAKLDSLRSELQLQVNLITEEEITKTLELLSDIREKVGIKKEDKELEKMLERIDTSYIERSLQKQAENGGNPIMKIIHSTPHQPEKTPEKK